jgi:ethanolamine utilization protein EutA
VFRRSRIFTSLTVLKGSETIHATVLGAGAHTVNVSGSTIKVSKGSLPLRNVPVVYPEVRRDGSWTWLDRAGHYDGSLYKTVALVVPPLPDTRFETIARLSESLAAELGRLKGSPKVVVTQQDIAKVLGQALQCLMGPVPLVCLDGIELRMGDYIDIAKPLPHQEAVPVIVKTLVFAR